MAVAFRVIFVRHGESYGNLMKIIQGRTDAALSEKGIKQGIEAGKSLRNEIFSRVYASPLCRALVTCQKILEQNDHSSIEIKTDTRLMERGFGLFEGETIEKCEQIVKETLPKKSWLSYTPEGAETAGEVQERMVKFFKELCQFVYDKNKVSTELDNKDNGASLDENGESPQLTSPEVSECILIVSHGYALRTLYDHLAHNLSCEDLEISDSKKLSPNTGISEFIVRYSPRKYILQCLRIHDGAHLTNVEG